ncbi:aminotransferase class IV [Sphingobacterium gobiense]|uniref:Branched-chain amino acid aminotransferase n=1 Tax=Sphingobacterium gobiense TaxID=1382456 RepID=A0A2S9JNV9_9SPHI|nr:aminotransferase class IV [Sphingobacterium gobiense]PRD54679.1 hypothetical protein C5749_14695 [Sphingobacterium gobiense]
MAPLLSYSILDGIISNSLIQLCRDLRILVEERRISIAELADTLAHNENVEVFGSGTAAIVSPIASIQIDGVEYRPYTGDKALTYRLKNELEEIRRGRKPDTHG